MDFSGSLDYLYALQRFGIKLGLENIRGLLERLGHPQRSFAVIHVAGTNGKGSVAASLASILRAAGQKTGLYTSPHLHSFTERIQIDGRSIAEAEVARLTEEIRAVSDGIPATFFEFTTAMALLHFHRCKVRYAILETGMGGRLDATNAVTPCLSILTPVSFDHAEHLGETLAEIAAEKAGIIKQGVPVLCARQQPEALAVIRDRAEASRAPLFQYGGQFRAATAGRGIRYQGLEEDLDIGAPGLEGAHQAQNAAVALCAAELLRRQGASIGTEAMTGGIETVRWPGRLEWRLGRTVLLDGAHNRAGVEALTEYLRTLPCSSVRLVVGVKGERRPAEILEPLLPFCETVYCTEPPVDEAVPATELASLCRARAKGARALPSPSCALKSALQDRREGEVVLVAGSLFLVAAARELLGESS